jgi:hypothetical protein
VGVWDGPDVLVERRRPRLIDFGNVEWAPLIHFIANRQLAACGTDRDRGAAFREAVAQRVELSPSEDAAVPLYIRVNAGLYAKFAAWKLRQQSAHGESSATTYERLNAFVALLTA